MSDVRGFFVNELPRYLPGYEQREGQIVMAEVVMRAALSGHETRVGGGAHDRGIVVLLDAGTGVGKSKAYLAPSAMFHLRTKQRVLVSTSSIALMDQMEQSELPLLRNMFDVSTAVLKGQANYVCVRRLPEAERLVKIGEKTPAVARLVEWAQTTRTGDRKDLVEDPGDDAWAEVSIRPGTCKGRACRDFRDCHMVRARALAGKAAIVVTNHHLLLHTVRVGLQTGGGSSLLRQFGLLVVDEAHNLADIARDVLGFTLSRAAVRRLLRLAGVKNDQRADVEGAADRFFQDLVAIVRRGDTVRLKEPPAVAWRPLVSALARLEEYYLSRVGETDDPELRSDLAGVVRQVDEIRGQVADACELRTPTSVYFVEPRKHNNAVISAVLRSNDLDPADKLAQGVWDVVKAGVVTSATLATGGFDRFAFARDELGIRSREPVDVSGRFHEWHEVGDGAGNRFADVRELVSGSQFTGAVTVSGVAFDGTVRLTCHRGSVEQFDLVGSDLDDDGVRQVVARLSRGEGRTRHEVRDVRVVEGTSIVSPFDYARRCALAVPRRHDIGVKHPRFPDRVAREVREIAATMGGRTLGLFTSFKILRFVAAAMREHADVHGQPLYRLLVQGEMGKGKLLDMFVRDETSVLLGTRSFWTGVDAPGPVCAAVVLDRIPFPSPGDPVMAALDERLDDCFNQQYVPRAVRQFLQGLGRGFRRGDDACIVHVMDERVVTKRYGNDFLSALPRGMRVLRSDEDVAKFSSRVLDLLGVRDSTTERVSSGADSFMDKLIENAERSFAAAEPGDEVPF